MKLITKLSFIAATIAALGTNAAFADDQQLQNRLAVQRAEAKPEMRLQYHFNSKLAPYYVPVKNTTTVAAYAGGRGVGRTECAANEPRSEVRYELRWNANGQRFGLFVPDK